MASKFRRPLYFNRTQTAWESAHEDEETWSHLDSLAFHKRLPGYYPTKLAPLKQVADDFGVGTVYAKYEGDRLALSSFKILDAS
jgi:hypothetical protein